ncbi:hypothetical protein [Bradyrhizobium sp. SYSU BS000235]|uniref:hypothetical protein n=1 Tax=Bradyrhizobium sp. SYSU BS000235 TaxID=3411332 RepID=UPI003C71DDA1
MSHALPVLQERLIHWGKMLRRHSAAFQTQSFSGDAAKQLAEVAHYYFASGASSG